MKVSLLGMVSVVMILSSTSICDVRPLPLRKEQLIGAWVGCAYACQEFYRLELAEQGSGTFVTVGENPGVDLYDIPNWKLEDEKLSITLKPIGKARHMEVRSIHLDTGYLQIEVRDEAIGWKRTVVLNNESAWEEKTRRARQATAHLQKR